MDGWGNFGLVVEPGGCAGGGRGYTRTLQVRRNESTQHGELEFMRSLTRPCATESAVVRSSVKKVSPDVSESSLRAPAPPDEVDALREYRLTMERRMVSSLW